MPRNPDLVPQVVTDVNGRVTTVYRKPASSSLGKNLPAPVLPKGTMVDSLAVRAGELLGMGERGYHDLRISLRQYTPEFLSWLTPVLAEDGAMSSRIAGMVNNGFNEPLIRDSALFQRLVSETGRDILVHHWPTWVMGLHRYDQFDEVMEFGLEDEAVQSKCVSLLLVTEELEGARLTERFLERGRIVDDSLVKLVLERPGDAPLIASIVREHGVTEATTILGLMNGIAPSLANGSL